MNRRIIFTAAATLMPALALAHPGDATAHGFLSGAAHPWTGIDHLAAMLAAGLWAARLGGRSLFTVPCATALGIAAGALLGALQGSLLFAEPVTAASAIVLGLLVLLASRPHLPVAALLVGSFGLFHGYVHAVETPQQYWQPAFTVGFIGSMLVLQGLGMALAKAFPFRTVFVRTAGASCAVAGFAALILAR